MRENGLKMSKSFVTQYYLDRKKKYLKDFHRILKPGRTVLAAYFDPEEVPLLVAETRKQFEDLLPQVPYVGGEKPFTDFLIFTAMGLALYRVFSAHGKTLEQTAEILYEIEKAFLQSTPKFLVRFFAQDYFSQRYLERVRQRAVESQERLYPENYVFAFIEGDGVNFDYGIDYLECGACKFLESQGAFELARFFCPVDILYSETLGWGLSRTQTIAEGAETCDFRFKRGGPTNVDVPDELREIVARGF
jgi:hypothetical protein